jgi:hypothetical protein
MGRRANLPAVQIDRSLAQELSQLTFGPAADAPAMLYWKRFRETNC